MKSAYFLPVLLLSVWCKAQNGRYPYTEKNKWGLTDKNKTVLVKPQYDTIDLFRNGFARVGNNKKVGLINTSGVQVVSCSYTIITEAFADGTAIARAPAKGFQIISTRDDKPVGTLVFEGQPERSQYAKGSFYYVQKDGKMGVFDAATGKLSGGKYDGVTGFNDPALAQYAIINTDGKYGVLDVPTGREVLQQKYDDIEETYAASTVYIAARLEDGEKIAYYDAAMHAASPGETHKATMPAEDADASRVNKKAKDMYIYKLGADKWRVVLENRETSRYKGLDSTDLKGYTSLEYLSYYANDKLYPTKIKAVKDGKTGVIDMSGKVLVPFVYDDIKYREDMVGHYAFLETRLADKKGIIVASTMTELKKPVLKNIIDEDVAREALLIEMPNGQKGYLDKTNGEIYIPGVKE